MSVSGPSGPLVKFFTLIFGDKFLIINFSKMYFKSCIGDLVPTSPKGPSLVEQTDFCVHR